VFYTGGGVICCCIGIGEWPIGGAANFFIGGGPTGAPLLLGTLGFAIIGGAFPIIGGALPIIGGALPIIGGGLAC